MLLLLWCPNNLHNALILTPLSSFYNRYYRSTYGTEASTWLYNQGQSPRVKQQRAIRS